ncbi:hypothetical protein M8494_36175 [Serratia ureilytica]
MPTKQRHVRPEQAVCRRAQVYRLIRQYYPAQFLPLHEVDVTEATFNIGGQPFRTRGKAEAVAGWKVLFQHDASEAKRNRLTRMMSDCLPW